MDESFGKRYALLLANGFSLVGDRKENIPPPSLNYSVDLIQQGLQSLGDYSFGRPRTTKSSSGPPEKLVNQGWKAFYNRLEVYSRDIDDDTLFLLYYFGHGRVYGDDQLYVSFTTSKVFKKRPLYDVIKQLHDNGVRNLILIADNCHAGSARKVFSDFEREGKELSYCVLAASQNEYTYHDEYGGLWTSALSRTLAESQSKGIVDPGRGYGTFSTWFREAKQVAEDNDPRMSPCLIPGGLENHKLFPKQYEPPSQFLGNTTDKTIYNRLYQLLCMLSEQPRATRELRQYMERKKQRVFLIASGADSENGDRYISTDAIDRYLLHATRWGLIEKDNGVSSTSQRYVLTSVGSNSLSNNGSRYNKVLNESIYRFLRTYGIDRELLDKTMGELISDHAIPDVGTFLKKMQTEPGTRSLDPADLEFALRMLSQSGDFRKNTGNVFFPRNPRTLQ